MLLTGADQVTAATLADIQGPVTVGGDGTAEPTLDDTADAAANDVTVDAGPVAGLGMAATGVAYAGLAPLTVLLGDGGNAVTVTGTAAATDTRLTGGNGGDTFAVDAVDGPTTITTRAGTNTVGIDATGLLVVLGGG